MNRAILFAFILSGVIGVVSGSVRGDAAGDYEALFGAEAKKVAASATKSDDAAFAAKLVTLAKDMADAPAAQVYFCEKAFDFGSASTAGYKTAMEALAFLQKAEPGKKLLWIEKKLQIAKGQYSRTYGVMKKAAAPAYIEALAALADVRLTQRKPSEAKLLYDKAIMVAKFIRSDQLAAITAKRKRVDALVAQDAKFKSLHDKLAKDPTDSATREQLIILYIVDLNNPADAAKLLSDDLDETLRMCVSLAGKDVADLAEAACMDLGEWYCKTLLPKASAVGKPIVLLRAKRYYERFLALHTKADVQSIRAKMALQKIYTEMRKLRVRTTPEGLNKYVRLDMGKGVTLKLVLIPAGKFQMGSMKSSKFDRSGETPRHEVTISKPFYMGVTEVTQEQYEAVTRVNPSRYKGAKNPVDSVTWKDASAFCLTLANKANLAVRLPTEAQWEYACRAGSTRRFSFGDLNDKLDDYGWFGENSNSTSHPVARKKSNVFGLYDMHGNVREWCADVFSTSYYTADKAVDPENKPLTATAYSSRSLRGGYFRDAASYCISAKRFGYSPTSKSYRNGFRVIILVVPPRKDSLAPAKLVGKVGAGGIRGTQISYLDPTVTQAGKLLFGKSKDELRSLIKIKEPRTNVEYSMLGSAAWTDYTFSIKATRKQGPDGFFIRFADNGRGDYFVWNIGGKGNRRFSLERIARGRPRRMVKTTSGSIQTNKTYEIQVELNGSTVTCRLDKKLVFKVDMSKIPK